MARSRERAWLAAPLSALVLIAPATAASLRVSPIGFEMAAGQRAASLSVQDDGDDPMTVQVRVFRWVQRGGADILEPTGALLASPPFASLDAGAAQTVRLIRDDTPGADGGEQAFRLLVDELPPASGDAGQQVRLLMRHSVPVFVEPAHGGHAQVAWRGRSHGGVVWLAATNTGGRRLRLANLKVYDGQERLLAERLGLAGYVLAGSALTLNLPAAADAPADGVPARLQADTDLGRLDAPVAGP